MENCWSKIRFRTFLQDYLKSVTVYREKVVFLLDLAFGVLDNIKKEYTFERRLFKTPTQKNVIKTKKFTF